VSARTTRELAQALEDRGDRVTVVTGYPRRPGGRLYRGFRRSIIPGHEGTTDSTLLRCFSTISKRSTVMSRVAENLSFGVFAAAAVGWSRGADVAYLNSWPILSESLLLSALRAKGIPAVLCRQDVYPESLVARNQLRQGSLLFRMLESVDACLAHTARRVLVLGPEIREKYALSRRLLDDRVVVIKNWIADRTETPTSNAVKLYRASLGARDEDVLLLYGGNLGRAADVRTLILGFVGVRRDVPVRLAVLGDGSEAEDLRRLADDLCDSRLTVRTPWPADETKIALAAADVLLLPTAKGQSFASVPSKVLDYMCAGRAIVALCEVGTTLHEAMRDAGCGWTMEPGNVGGFSMLVESIASQNPSHLEELGQNGLKYATDNYGKAKELLKLLALLDQVASETRQAGP
jgi:colanic acid biosynthesis glycosyl transferase WcaI